MLRSLRNENIRKNLMGIPYLGNIDRAAGGNGRRGEVERQGMFDVGKDRSS